MNSIFKNFMQVVIFFGLNKIIYLVLAFVMSRTLGVEGVGRYGFILAFIGLFFMSVGIGQGLLCVILLHLRKINGNTFGAYLH